jgi:hypothetical protein
LDDDIGDELDGHNRGNPAHQQSIVDSVGQIHYLGDSQMGGDVVGGGDDVGSVDADANARSIAAVGLAWQNGSVEDSLDDAFGDGGDYCCRCCWNSRAERIRTA